ncbi:hypothetical protein ACH5RR_027366 [Cinchona calisaya]|uniref:AMP-dependent synthetase/ligase domain-containing protein n=1 Tax=Cinchona calisaya TaxID=153742 RepID=A0ABD2Z589_9GENT
MFLLLTIVSGATCVLTSPSTFTNRPQIWLELITLFRATCTPVPSFTLPLVLKRGGIARGTMPIKLESLKNLIVINEPIYKADIEEFVEAFRPFGLSPLAISPSYGLAENCTFVSTAWRNGRNDSLPTYKKLLPSARLIPFDKDEEDIEIIVVNEETQKAVEDGIEGEIWISSPGNASGYLGHPFLTREVFNGMLRKRMQKSEGDQTVLRNICEGIRKYILEEENVAVGLIVLVESGRVPRTTSGKIQRWATCTPIPYFTLPLVLKRDGIARGTKPIKLESLKNLIVINEPIYNADVEELVEAFRPFGLNPLAISPSYSLAENCTFVSIAWRNGRNDSLPTYKKLLPSARLIPFDKDEEDIEIIVVIEGTQEVVEDGIEGEIWISSPGNASGYLGHPSLTREVFNGMLRKRMDFKDEDCDLAINNNAREEKGGLDKIKGRNEVLDEDKLGIMISLLKAPTNVSLLSSL